METVADGKQVLADNAVTDPGLPAFGPQVLMNVINGVGGLPARSVTSALKVPVISRRKPWRSRARATASRT